MILSFQLSMPNNNSWNGKWTGDDVFYAKVINFGRSKKADKNAESILNKGYFHYNFGDGWAAGIDVKEVDSGEARSIRKKTKGFCGYDWMVDSIRLYGEIRS